MTPERWQQINAVLDAVLEQPLDQRTASLDEYCRDDPDLRREVLSLLEAHDQAQTFLEEPAKDFAAPLIPPDDLVDPLIGQTIDGYRILGVLGRGGMGIVYKAEDEALSRTVAIKMIDPTLARDEAFVHRFRREARALARIDSTHIVGVHAMRQTEAGLFIVMEFVDGGTVDDLLDDGPLPWPRACPIIVQMLTALEHAHSVDVIHRDIKPSNIMLTGQGVVKVTDFGLAKMSQGGGATTVTQGIAGTLYYMSPEQVKGARDLDSRSDLYSMGMTIYKMLCGRLPYDPEAASYDVMRSIVEDDLPPPTVFKPDVPKPVVDALMKAMEKDADRRYQTAAEMRAAFEAVKIPVAAETLVEDVAPYKPEPAPLPDPRPRPRALRAVTAVLGVAVLALAAYILWPQTDPPDPPLFTLTTTPAQAAVFLNGDSIGATPITDHPLAAGTDSLFVRILKTDYAPVETTLVAAAGVPLEVNLDLKAIVEALPVDSIRRATLRISSSTGNANVQINGENQGTTDAEGVLEIADVEPGGVTVLITKNGYNDWRGTIEAVAGETVPVVATLEETGQDDPPEQATGSLMVQVVPSGTVTVQGANCRAGARCVVPVGTARVTCRRNGVAASTTVRIRANRPSSLTCYTEHEVRVQVRTEADMPIWAGILIDGSKVDEASDKAIPLGPGTYRIEVERNLFDILTPPKSIRIEPAFEQKPQRLVFQIRER